MIRAFRAATALIFLALAACGGSTTTKTVPRHTLAQYHGPAVTQVVVNKGDRRMFLLNGKTVLRSYDVGLGNNPVGHKRFEGDGRTPEGIYFIDRMNPNSRYHLSLGISYPRPQDRAYAAQFGRRAGGDIFFHGRGPEGRAATKEDWTAGCIAVEDAEIEEIFSMLRPGVPVVIYP